MLRAVLTMVLLVSMLAGCAMTAGGEGRDESSALAAVGAVLDDFHAGAAEADGERYFGHFAEDGVFVGTDATERWTVEAFRAYAESHFAEGRGWKYEPVERHVRVAPGGQVAWFDERLVNEAYGETRGSGVLRLVDGAWRIEQYVLSFPIPNEVARDVVERIQEHEAGGD